MQVNARVPGRINERLTMKPNLAGGVILVASEAGVETIVAGLNIELEPVERRVSPLAYTDIPRLLRKLVLLNEAGG